MSRHILLIILFVCTKVQSYSQKYIEWQYTDTEYGLATNLLELKSGSLICSQLATIIGPPYSKITKVTKEGKYSKDVLLVNDSLRMDVKRIIPIGEEDKLMVLGSAKIRTDSFGYWRHFFMVLMDTNLNIIKTEITKFDANGSFHNLNYYKPSEDTLLVVLNFTDGTFGPMSQDLYLKMDKEGTILNKQTITGYPCLSILPSSAGYDCLGIKIKKLTKNFEFVSESQTINLYFGATNQSSAVRLSPTKILGGTNYSLVQQIPAGAGPVLYLFDNNYNLKKFTYLTTPPMSIVPIDVFGITPDSSVYLCNYESVGTAFRSFTLAKFDMDFKKKWEIHHADDPNFRYRLWNMEATNDNGVILYGIWYRQQNWLPIAGMIKINENGNLVWTHNIPASEFRIIKCYPNPSDGIFRLDLQGITAPADLRIFDMSGRNVYVQTGLHEGDNTIDLTGLPSGTYVYKVYQGSREIGQGEWVKI